jgi:hypothetical protein
MSWQLRRAKAAKRSRPLRGRLLKIRGLWRSSSVIRWPPCGFAVHLDVAKLNLTLSSELFTNRHWQFEFTSLRQVTQEGIKLPWEVSEYDGQAELCFDSVEEMNAAFNEPVFFWRKFTRMTQPSSTWKGVSLWSLRKSRKLPSGPF